MRKVKWPSRKKLDAMIKKLDNTEGTVHLSEDATPLEHFRWELCQRLVAYMYKHGLKQKEMAKKLGVDEPQMSRILHHRIDKVSTDKLLRMVQILDPHIKLRVG